jgi:hypothetical protein
LDTLLAKAGLDPKNVGSIGFGGFSAYHQFLNPLLQVPGVADRVDYVHLADACFSQPNPTEAKKGFLLLAKRAVAGKARMTVTTNGPWGKSISYSGPKGSKYEGRQFNLSSGAQCFEQVWRAAAGELSGIAEVPKGIAQPTRAYKKGELYWFHYETGLSDPHGDHARQLAEPIMQMYGVPWMAGHRGLQLDMKGLLVGSVFAGAGYLGYKYFLGNKRL